MKARLATPISHLFRDPRVAARIVEASDCLEARDASPPGRWARQEVMHLDAPLNLPWDDALRAHVASELRARPRLQLASFHLPSCCDRPRLDDGIFWPGGETYGPSEMLRHAAINVAWLRASFGERLLLAVENNNFYPTPAYRWVTDGPFLRHLVRELDLALLLDVAHARVTAHNRGLGFAEYLRSLPLGRTVQLHVSRPDLSGELARDAHDAPQEDDLTTACELVRMLPVLWLGIEYYRDAEALLDALAALRRPSPATSRIAGAAT